MSDLISINKWSILLLFLVLYSIWPLSHLPSVSILIFVIIGVIVVIFFVLVRVVIILFVVWVVWSLIVLVVWIIIQIAIIRNCLLGCRTLWSFFVDYFLLDFYFLDNFLYLSYNHYRNLLFLYFLKENRLYFSIRLFFHFF